MDENQINTVGDLLGLIEASALAYKGSLEGYLRRLWAVIEENEEQPVSPELIGNVFMKAATQEPVPFNDGWLNYERPAYREDYDGSDDGGFEYLRHTILFQIADLRRMEAAGTLNLNPVVLSGGVDSPTGHRWYNFQVPDYLGCGTRGYGDHSKPVGNRDEAWAGLREIARPLDSRVCTWYDLAEILELGRLYE